MLLKLIRKGIAALVCARVYQPAAATVDVGVVAADGDGAPAPEPDAAASQSAVPPEYFKEYMGSKDLNPDQRPIKYFDRTGYSQKDIDNLIQVTPASELYMSDEELKEIGHTTVKEGEPEKKPEPSSQTFGDTAKPDADVEMEDFFKYSGLKSDNFKSLPEHTQKLLVENFEKRNAVVPAAEIDDVTKTMLKDGLVQQYIKARQKELVSGKKYTADGMPKVDESAIPPSVLAEITDAITSGEEGKAKKLIAGWADGYLRTTVGDAVAVERNVRNEAENAKKDMDDSWAIITKAAEIDPRLKPPEGSRPDRNPDTSTEFGKFFQHLIDQGFTTKTVKQLGSKKLYALYSIERGWDQERDKKIASSAQRSLLDRLTKPGEPRGTGAPNVKPPITATSDGLDGTQWTRQGLIDAIANGDSAAWNRAVEQSQMDSKRLNELDNILAAGLKARQEKQRSANVGS
jgi:hypothetical protein